MRNNFDFAPYKRATVGFDRLFEMLENSAAAAAGEGYPPFDLEKVDDDNYRISLAVAGFKPDEIDIVAHRNQLIITGRKAEDGDASQHYLHRGIAARPFERRFELADFIEVHSAAFENGLLTISLTREVPEAMKPRKIAIASGDLQQQVEAPERKREAA